MGQSFSGAMTGSSFKIKKGDTVKVISGKEKGKTGQVLQVDRDNRKIFIEKVNMNKKHMKPSQKRRQGGIIDREGALNISNVMLVCRSCNQAVRVGMKILNDGKKLRYCKKCTEVIDTE